jgi:hypothetical protein
MDQERIPDIELEAREVSMEQDSYTAMIVLA